MKTLTRARAVLVILVLAGCSSSDEGPDDTPTGPTSPPGDGTTAVSIIDFQFSPNNLEISVGSEVKWTNTGAAAHTATSDSGQWDSGSMSASTSGGAYGGTASAGGTYSRSFDQAGTYVYHCEFHPNMTGRIVVSD